ncbi:MAG: phenylalanine--tRNA ligase subunit beta [Candidatus Aenigmatarchaeota archaeon]
MVVLETKLSLIKKLVGEDFDIVNTLFDFGYEAEIDGENLKIDISPERIDLLSTRILAKNIKCWIGKNESFNIESKDSNYEIFVDNSVKKIRPFIMASVVKNCEINDSESLIILQEKLAGRYGRNRKKASIGLYNLDLIKFPVYYKALEPEKIKFVPLYFNEELNGKEILEKHPKGIEFGHLVKSFSKYPVLIDSNGKFLSMPPIINSNDIGKIDEKTKNIFVEVTGFDLKIIDQILKVISLELDGEIYKVKIHYKNKTEEFPIFTKKTFYLTKNYVNKNLGLNLSENDISNNLKRTGFECEIENGKIKVFVPAIRFDVIHEFDLLDEIARAYNFNKFELKESKITQTNGSLTKKTIIKEKISEIFVGLGFFEVSPFAITNEKDQFDKMNLERGKYVKIKNPNSENFTMIRVWILPELLKVLKSNIRLKQPIKIFEVGDVLEINEKKWNKTHLCFLICGEKITYTNGRQCLEALLDYLKIKYEFKEIEHKSFIKGRVAGVFVNNEQIGFVGELSPDVLYNFEIYYPVTACEINIYKLF